MVDSRLPLIGVGPDDLLFASHFKQFGLARGGMVGRDHRVSVRQSLPATCVVKWLRWEVVVGNLPDRFTSLIDFDCQVSDRAVDQRIPIIQPDRGEWPVGGCDLPDDFSIGLVFADDLIQQLWHEVVPVRQLASHSGLQMVVLGLSLQRNFDDDLSFAIDFQQPRLVASLRQHDVAVLQSLSRIHFGLSPLEFEDDFSFAGHLNDRTAVVGFGKSQQDIAVGQDPAVARRPGI
jgi:hypothetical protein